MPYCGSFSWSAENAVQEHVHLRYRRLRQIVREQREALRSTAVDRQFGIVSGSNPAACMNSESGFIGISSGAVKQYS